MSTYCHRIVEYLNNESKWVRCGETVDCFHGFDQWRNEDYYDRGFPSDATVKKDDLKDEDGNLYAWGFSYITLQELSAWCEKEKSDFYSYIFSDIHQGLFKDIARKLDMIVYRDTADEEERLKIQESYNKRREDSNEASILTDFSYFKECCEEAAETAEMLNNELVRSYALADQVASKEEEYWVDPDRIRIVYYFE